MVKVYGASDDLVEIEGSDYNENEIGCFDRDVRITFTDGTVILAHYGKPSLAVWEITVEKTGSSGYVLSECNDEDADPYSDVFEINSEVLRHSVVRIER